jgi:two-component system chemotaxis response regulator CheY
MRFLVVDDSMAMRRIVLNVLARLGHTDVILASNGREALKRIESEPVDFIVTDWFMPEMSGVELVRAVRENDAFKDLPIVVVTANASRHDVAEAVKLRVNAYVLKPFTAELLKERIAAICAALPDIDRSPSSGVATVAADTGPGDEPGLEVP